MRPEMSCKTSMKFVLFYNKLEESSAAIASLRQRANYTKRAGLIA